MSSTKYCVRDILTAEQIPVIIGMMQKKLAEDIEKLLIEMAGEGRMSDLVVISISREKEGA